MKVSLERLENSQVMLNIEGDAEEVEASLEKAYRRLVAKTDIPGFRRGKAPRPLLERYLGRATLLEEALDHLVPELYSRALEEQGIEAIARPQIEVTQTDPVAFKATVLVRPTVELGDYHQLRIEVDPVDVTEEQVEAALEQVRSSQALWEPVERQASSGDLITLNVKGAQGGNTFLREKGVQYHLLAGSPSPLPGFAEEVVGLGKGEEKEFTLSFPPDHEVKEIAGKEYSFKVAVTEIKERNLPELNDDFAKGLGQGLDTVEDLRERVATNLRAGAEAEARRRLGEEAVARVVEISSCELPSILVEREIDRLLAERRERQGGVSQEERLGNMVKTEEKLRGELQPFAEGVVRRSLVLDRVAEVEGIGVAEEEIDAEVERLTQAAGEKGLRRTLSSPAARESLRRMLFARKTVERLVEIASGEAEAPDAEGTQERGTR